MKALVTGGFGMLGEAMQRVFVGHELAFTDLYSLDVRNYYQVIDCIDSLPYMPEYIFHLAAETNLELCEIRPDNAYMTNTIGTANIVKLAECLKIPIIYISTAGVFDGRLGRAYDEDDVPNPVNAYGRSKYYGEIIVRQYEKHYIFRMSWAMGGGPKLDKKFVNKIYAFIKRGDKTIYAIKDLYGSPTYMIDVALSIKNLLLGRIPYGTYHLAGKGSASRYDVAKAIVEILKEDIDVVAVGEDHFKKSYFCPRAKNETLETKSKWGIYMRDWRESLEQYLRNYYV